MYMEARSVLDDSDNAHTSISIVVGGSRLNCSLQVGLNIFRMCYEVPFLILYNCQQVSHSNLYCNLHHRFLHCIQLYA